MAATYTRGLARVVPEQELIEWRTGFRYDSRPACFDVMDEEALIGGLPAE